MFFGNAWARASEKATVSAYEEYLASNSEGKYRAEALKKIAYSVQWQAMIITSLLVFALFLNLS